MCYSRTHLSDISLGKQEVFGRSSTVAVEQYAGRINSLKATDATQTMWERHTHTHTHKHTHTHAHTHAHTHTYRHLHTPSYTHSYHCQCHWLETHTPISLAMPLIRNPHTHITANATHIRVNTPRAPYHECIHRQNSARTQTDLQTHSSLHDSSMDSLFMELDQ